MTRPFTPAIPVPGLQLVQQRFASLQQTQPQIQPIFAQSQPYLNDPARQRLQSISSAGEALTQASRVATLNPSPTGEIDPLTGQRRLQAKIGTSRLQSRSQPTGRLQAGIGPKNQVSQVAGYSGLSGQIAQWARQAGWAEKDIPIAIAVAMAESSGNPAASHRNTNGSIDTGLFQVNSIHRNGAAAGLNLNDPIQNAKAALNVFNQSGGSWKPWVTFNTGAYKKFLPTSTGLVQTQIQPFAATTPNGTIRANALNVARHAIGVPYVWGGNSLQKGVDCSGLVQQVYKSLGVSLPRTADEQSHAAIGTRTNISNLQPGDLVAWQGGWRGPNYVGHIAIYAGNGRIIEAPDVGMTVRERVLRPGENVFGVALRFAGE